MRKLIVALGMTSAVCLSSAAVALADGAPPPTQATTQSATTGQLAGALSSAQQVQPQNYNVSIRINSPGNDGDVTQTNSASSAANAGNEASTSQTANQSSGASAPWWPYNPPVPQRGSNPWSQPSAAPATQPSTAPVAPAPAPPTTTQSNSADSGANSGNDAGTRQNSNQSQGSSCGCDGSNGGVQSVDQQANTDQAALAASKAVQIDPKNQNVSIRINSPGNDGNVTQTNSVTSTANAGNEASTEQHASQGQAAAQCGCNTNPITRDSQPPSGDQCGCNTIPITGDSQPPAGDQPQSSDPAANSAVAPASSPALGVQAVSQDASTKQAAIAGSAAIQSGASNANYPIRINSGGDSGNVTQSNTVSSAANAGNEASTHQRANQSGGSGSSCGCGGTDIQAADQKAETAQGALALSGAIQQFGDGKPSRCGCDGGDGGSGNTASPVRVWSPGTDGNLTQTNSVDSQANAGNEAHTGQNASQNIGGGGGLQVQALGQEAGTLQGAFAGSLAAQLGASNDYSPVRVWSPGGGGSVSQTNSASSAANAGNDARTWQNANQGIGGKRTSCGCSTLPIQALDQQAWTAQFGLAGSGAFQLDPKNSSSPVRVSSPDRGGKKGDGESIGPQDPGGYGSTPGGGYGSTPGGGYGSTPGGGYGSMPGGSYGSTPGSGWDGPIMTPDQSGLQLS